MLEFCSFGIHDSLQKCVDIVFGNVIDAIIPVVKVRAMEARSNFSGVDATIVSHIDIVTRLQSLESQALSWTVDNPCPARIKEAVLHEDAIRRLSVNNTSHLENVAVFCGCFDLFALIALLSYILKDRLSIDVLVEEMGARYIEISAHRTEKGPS